MPPEVAAYALARYSRSADSFEESLRWVKAHDKGDFMSKFYFQYGHASIADLGHVTMCFEGISELAAVEIEDEAIWDGQAKSTRYQDFSQAVYIMPPELTGKDLEDYCETAEALLEAYREVHSKVRDYLFKTLPKPAELTQDAYDRTLNARAFDVARYLLFLGIPTNVGQVTSIRTLEKQMQRLAASPYKELQNLASDMEAACASEPDVSWDDFRFRRCPPTAPSLAKYVQPNQFLIDWHEDLWEWYHNHVKAWPDDGLVQTVEHGNGVRLWKPNQGPASDILSTLLYTGCSSSYARLQYMMLRLGRGTIDEGIAAALKHRGPHDELPRAFRNQPYIFEITCDIGAYRDLHRHRRCQQFRQPWTIIHGYETPQAVIDAGCGEIYKAAMDKAGAAHCRLKTDYILPFGTRVRFLMKMDFAEAEYIIKLRSGVKGHFSYRRIANQMADELKRQESILAHFITTTPMEVEAPLTR
jgi:thymidylate synthase ThyX